MKSINKKIIFLSNIDRFFISHRLQIGLELISKGYEVHIATEFTKYKKKLLNKGFKVHNIEFNRNSLNLFKSLKPLFQILILYFKVKPDIVHLISLKPIVFGGIASKIIQVKSIVASITGLGSIYLGNSFNFKIKRLTINFIMSKIFLKKKLKVIVQNKSDLNYLRNNTKILKSKLVLIKGSGVDLKKFNFTKLKSSKTPIILMASRLIADKGVNEYIEAIKILRTKLNFKGTFLLIGDVDQDNPTAIKKSDIELWKKQDLIEHSKFTKKIIKYIKKSTIVVLPSYREGFAKILIEAAACGRPVITTNVPGCKDAVVNKKTGLIVNVKDPLNLAKGILKLSKNRKILNSMSKNSREHAIKNFNIKNVISSHIEVYNSII